MTFVSYAQNFEDVLIWRALGDLDTGFYIDVGASHPDIDSVTRAFYDRGWSGINIEPTASAFLRLTAARPRDVNLQVAAGKSPGSLPFFVVEGADAGLSTLDAGSASQYGALGLGASQTTVTVDTLAEICRLHAPADIHFLKVDVEGAERSVLEGADFATYRPWIVVVEATAPMSTRQVHLDWEEILLAAEYRCVWFDGLNRFYIADEHHSRLAPSFKTPPNVFDDFLRAADTEWTRRLHQAETRSATLLERVQASEARVLIAEDRAERAYLQLAKASATSARLDSLASQHRIEAERLQQALAEALSRAAIAEQTGVSASDWLAAIRSSTSWRITAPLRRLMGAARRDEPTLLAPPPVFRDPDEDVVATPPRALPAPRRTLSDVHQFHSGSAPGDAITNAMLLTRRLLRDMGFGSHIFTEHRHPACAGEVHSIDDLPRHEDYALIVRHSMGHDALPRILALRVPKILIYHNITPPGFLSDSPYMQDYALKGRNQLSDLRPAVAAALADSEFNALELRQAGFAPVTACPLLFDIDAMLAATGPPRRGPVFTILFVGRIARAKGQLALVSAYARFKSLYKGESKLVLVGRQEGAFAAELLALVRHHEMDTGAVELTGLVTDAELHRHYAEADLYVSLSQHEGFGVPLVEAMAHGVPVLALASGAVPYTIDGTAPMLYDAAPQAVAQRILELATDPAARHAIAARQRQSLDRFTLARHLPALSSALEHAGVHTPAAPATIRALAASMRFTVAGHVNGTYSLAEVNRALALTIEAARPGMVRLLPVEGDVTATVSGIPPEQRDAIRAVLARDAPATRPEVVISQHYPIWVPPAGGDLSVALFYWEESLVPPAMVATLNLGFAGVLAPSATVAKALIDSGVDVPVRVLQQVPQLDRFSKLRNQRVARLETAPFTFLHVSSCFPRKGVDVLIAAYAEAFRRGDPVRLVIKGFPNQHNTVAEQVSRLQAEDADAPPIELIDADLSEPAMLALYRDADAMVLPTRGEGFNLPAAEAMTAGIPLIVTGHGGHMDFVAKAPPEAVRLISYRLAPSGSHLASGFSLWADPDVHDLAAALREAYGRGATSVSSVEPPCFGSARELADRLSQVATEWILAPVKDKPRLGWVTTWDVPCGIAGYSRHLLAEMPGNATIFADGRSTAGATVPGSPSIVPSWRVGDPASLPDLTSAILRHDPQALVLQHQPGLLRWNDLATLLDSPALNGRAVCVVLHNTRHLIDLPVPERCHVLGRLATTSRVVVHTIQDMNGLAGVGLCDNVTMIPQGAPGHRPATPPTIRTLSHDEPILIGCYGFFLPDKGIRQLIEALAILRPSHKQIRLRLVNAEYPDTSSAEEIAACRNVAMDAGLGSSVEFLTGFLDDVRSTALLADCDLIVLPYQRSQEASSAALRTALTAGVPVAVTPLPLFDEAQEAVIRLPGTTPAEMAGGIGAILAAQDARQASVQAAADWQAERSWPSVARRWDGLLRGLWASGIVMGRDREPHPVR